MDMEFYSKMLKVFRAKQEGVANPVNILSATEL